MVMTSSVYGHLGLWEDSYELPHVTSLVYVHMGAIAYYTGSVQGCIEGPLTGGPQSRLSLLRNGNVPCRYFRNVLVDFKIA